MKRFLFYCIVICVMCSSFLSGCFLMGKNSDESTNSHLDTGQKKEYTNIYDFEAMTTDSKCLTRAYFKKYDITLIYFWSPSSELSEFELRNFASFSNKLPENVACINVILDIEDGKNYYTDLKNAGINKMPSIISIDRDFKHLSDEIEELPTTIFVDSLGNIVGDPIIGIQLNYEEFEKFYLSKINKNLKRLKKHKIYIEEDD